MIEDRAERPQFRVITLVSPGEAIINDGGFHTEPRIVPEIGYVCLIGHRGKENWEGKEKGITIVNGKLSIKSANELWQKGLYSLYVHAFRHQKPGIDINCHIQVPNEGSYAILSSKLSLSGEDPTIRYSSRMSYKWNTPGVEDAYFYVPADPNFLSQLRFSFESVFNLQEIQPIKE
ncbi:MAG: hypothetical protein Q7K55_03430 [Candidatus Levybacteria bacterium]|nr:hypothetical protein [Candidatus Levybacteria bacterium]